MGPEIIPSSHFGRQDLTAQGSVAVTNLTFCFLAQKLCLGPGWDLQSWPEQFHRFSCLKSCPWAGVVTLDLALERLQHISVSTSCSCCSLCGSAHLPTACWVLCLEPCSACLFCAAGLGPGPRGLNLCAAHPLLYLCFLTSAMEQLCSCCFLMVGLRPWQWALALLNFLLVEVALVS